MNSKLNLKSVFAACLMLCIGVSAWAATVYNNTPITLNAGEKDNQLLAVSICKQDNKTTHFEATSTTSTLKGVYEIVVQNTGNGTDPTWIDKTKIVPINNTLSFDIVWDSYPTAAVQIHFVAYRDNSAGGSDIIGGTVTDIDVSQACAGGEEGCVLSSAKVVAEGYSAVKIQVELGADCQSVIVATNKATNATSELAIVEESGKQYVYLKGLNAETEYTYTLQAKDQSGTLVPTAGIDVTFATRCNIAQGKTVSASGAEGSLVATNANDGKTNTRWQALNRDKDLYPWWQVDLGETKSISAIEILWENAWGQEFDIEFSTDGSVWFGKHSIEQYLKPLETISGSFPYTQLIALKQTQKARYVRFTGKLRGNGDFSFYEFRVLTPCGDTPTPDPVDPDPTPTDPTSDCVLKWAKVIAEGYSSAKIEVNIDGDCSQVIVATNKATNAQSEVTIVRENLRKYIYLKGLAAETEYTFSLQTKENSAAAGVNVTFATRCNVAVEGTATASGYAGDMSASKANDGDNNTRWQAPTKDEQPYPTWTVDLGKTQTVSAVEILWEAAWGKKFDIEFSTDNSIWEKESFEQDLEGNTIWPYTQLVALREKHQAQYVRFKGIERGAHNFSFWEFRVITSCGTTPEPDDPAEECVLTGATVVAEGVTTAKIELDIKGDCKMQVVATDNTTKETKEFPIVIEHEKAYIYLMGLKEKTKYSFTLQTKEYDGTLTPANGVEVSFSTHCNIALDKQVSCSTSKFPAANANDNNENTAWESAEQDGQTWFVDLEEVADVYAVEIVWNAAYPKSFKLEFSEDGALGDFIEIKCNSLSDKSITLIPVNKKAKIVRFYGGERGTNWGYGFYEFRVASECSVDDNLVLDKVCKGSESHDATQSGSRDPNTANNNDRWGTIEANVWRSAANKDIWWQADLHTYKNGDLTEDSVYSINKVILYWKQENGACTPKNIRVDIAYATNPTERDWYSVGNSLLLTAEKKNDNQVFTFDFNGEITARWIRIYGTGGANNQAGNVVDYGYRLTEVEGYGATDLNEQHAKPSVEAEVSAVAVQSARLRLSGSDIDQTRKVHCFHVVNKNNPNQYWNASLRDNNELTVANLTPETYYELLVYSLDEWGRMSDPQTVTFTTLFNCSNDFATGKTVYASSAQGGCEANLAVDGNTDTRWGSQWENVSDEVRKNQWFLIDLGKNEIIDEITVLWETAGAATFQLLAADEGATINTTTGEITNGKQWTILHNQQISQYLTYIGSAAEASYPFEHTKARYVKFKGITTLSTWGYSMYEVRVFGCADTVPPHEVNARAENLTCSSATIVLSGRDYESDKKNETIVNSFIAYPLDKDGNEITAQRVIWSPAGITTVGQEGSFVLENLQMDTTYRYHVYAQDKSRNVSRKPVTLEFQMPRCEFVIYHHGQTPADNTENAIEEYAGGVIEYPIVYKRKFVPGRWETLCLPFDVESITIYDADDKQDYELFAQYNDGTDIIAGEFWLRTFTVKGEGVAVTADDFQPNWEDVHASSAQDALPKKNVAYIMQMPDAGGYYDDKFVVFHGKRKQYINERFAFPALPADDYYTYSGNTTMMPQKPTSAYVLTSDGLYFSSATKQTLYPFECMVNATQATIAKMPLLPLNKRPGVTTGNQLPTTVADNGSVWTIVGGYVGRFDNVDEYQQLIERLPEGMYIIRRGTQSSKLYITR